MRRLVLALVAVAFAALAGWPGAAMAHEIRPAYLQVTERADGRIDVLWKQPAQGEIAVALRPRIDRLLDRQPDRTDAENSFAILRWSNVDPGRQGLAGRTVRIDGLERTITDVLVVVRRCDGETRQQVLTPSGPSFIIESRGGTVVAAYVELGIEHILTGYDHLLFVFGLLLLSASSAALLRTITAFTVAHSITLGLTAFRVLAPPPSLVEALVALSIVFLAVELVRKARGEDGPTLRRPWLIAFAFGLLHGAAFAGALADIGLPRDNILGALLLFNVGVELGQLLFVAAVLAVLAAVRRVPLPAAAPRAVVASATYAIGGLSAFWFFERLHAAFAAVA